MAKKNQNQYRELDAEFDESANPEKELDIRQLFLEVMLELKRTKEKLIDLNDLVEVEIKDSFSELKQDFKTNFVPERKLREFSHHQQQLFLRSIASLENAIDNLEDSENAFKEKEKEIKALVESQKDMENFSFEDFVQEILTAGKPPEPAPVPPMPPVTWKDLLPTPVPAPVSLPSVRILATEEVKKTASEVLKKYFGGK